TPVTWAFRSAGRSQPTLSMLPGSNHFAGPSTLESLVPPPNSSGWGVDGASPDPPAPVPLHPTIAPSATSSTGPKDIRGVRDERATTPSLPQLGSGAVGGPLTKL